MRSHVPTSKQNPNDSLPLQRKPALRIGEQDDAYEREADRMADAVMNDGVDAQGLPLSRISIAPPLQRNGGAKKKSEEDKYTEALKKVGEAFLETGPGKEIKQKAEQLGDTFISTLPGKIIGGSALAGTVAALAATHSELPVEIPEIPLEVIKPGLKLKLTYEGPVDKPSKVMATFSIPLGPTQKDTKPAISKSGRFRAETARMAREQHEFREALKTPQQRADEQAMINAWVLSRQSLPGDPLLLGIGGGLPPPLAPYAPEFRVTGEQPGSAKPEKKKKKEAAVQRKASNGSRQGGAPAIVNEVLESSGQPLEPSAREFMESRFGHDFSNVRIHNDARASASASAVDAAAFTSGNHVVFASGRYRPNSVSGKHLLAHELAHVVQQGSGNSKARLIQHRSWFDDALIYLGLSEGEFSDVELKVYLDKITKNNKIEDKYDSDNKARAIVGRWRKADSKFRLNPAQKVLLIREMLSGPTLGEDEKSILELLELSDNIDLRRIFAPSGVSLTQLEKNLDGDSAKRLANFVAARFKGGRSALLKGEIEVIGAAGKGAPVFTYDWAWLKARIEGDYTLGEIQEIISRLDTASRDQALRDIGHERAALQRQINSLRNKHRAEKDPVKQEEILDHAKVVAKARNRLDNILQPIFRDIVVTESRADLLSATTVPDAAEKPKILAALAPDVKLGKGGKPEPFKPTLSGETRDYEQKLRDHLPTMIQNYYDSTVKGREKAVHKDPDKVHELKKFEEIGNVSKDETDALFGSYATGPALKADTKKKRGNIHDLFADMESDLRDMDWTQRRALARQLIFYFFQSDDFVRDLNQQHNASPKFGNKNKPLNDEAKSLSKLAKEFTKTRKQTWKLNLIDRGWTATAGGGHINIQIFKGETVDKDRDFLWDMFQTLIHEYLHTLVHDDYEKFAIGFGDTSNEYNTLIEGVDSLLTETVWANVAPRVNDAALREKIEGPTYSKLPPITVKPASRRRYASYAEAIKVVNIVGIRNLYVAYFLGKIDRIGA